MCKRNLDLSLVAGVLLIMLVSLFTATAYAAQCTTGSPPGIVCVDKPIIKDTVQSGEISYVELTINPTKPIFAKQYKLFLRCCNTPSCSTSTSWKIVTAQMCDPNSARFSYKLGKPSSGCPETYLWEVPLVQTVKKCYLGVQLLDEAFDEIARTESAEFNIIPREETDPLTLSPASAAVEPGGSAVYTINGGVAPYTVATLIGSPPPNFSITKINGVAGVVTLPGPYPVTFTVKNTAPCIRGTIIIAVQDSAGTRAAASYKIDCP
jgi:hypothetical protein